MAAPRSLVPIRRKPSAAVTPQLSGELLCRRGHRSDTARDLAEIERLRGAALGTGAAGGAYIPDLAPILCPRIGHTLAGVAAHFQPVRHGREVSQGGPGRGGPTEELAIVATGEDLSDRSQTP